MMTTHELSFNRPEVVAGFSVVFCFCWLRLIRVSSNVFAEIFPPYSFILPQSRLWNFMIFSMQFCRAVCCWEDDFLPFLDVIISFALSLRAWISDVSKHSSSSMSATKMSPFQIRVRSPGHVNKFQWNWGCFFLRHEELNSRFNVRTINEVTFH